MNNRKYMCWFLIGMGVINMVFLMTGVIVPWIVSSSALPVAGILAILTAIICAVALIGMGIFEYFKAKEKGSSGDVTVTLPSGSSVSVKCYGSGGGGGSGGVFKGGDAIVGGAHVEIEPLGGSIAVKGEDGKGKNGGKGGSASVSGGSGLAIGGKGGDGHD